MVLKPNAVVDIAKPGPQLQNLTGMWNARVLDGFTPFVVQFKENGLPVNLTNLTAFIEGDIGEGHYDSATDDVVMTGTPKSVRYTDDGSGNTNMGIVVFRLPPQFFIQTGIFKGFIGLQSSTGIRSTSNDVWFKVLGNSYTMGISCKYFISDLDKALQNFKEALRQHNIDYENQLNSNNAEFQRQVQQVITDARNAYNSQVANSRDAMNALDAEVKANRAELTNINDHLSGVEQQIAIHDIVTIPQHQEDLKNISNAIDERLANIKTAPVAVENAATLQQRYPNGADGIFIATDTGHKWLWLSGQWTDCGEYQAIGIGNELIDPIKQQQKVDEENIATNYSLINQNTAQIKENTTNIQSVEGAGALTYVNVTDQSGNRITDQNGNELIAQKWLVIVDKTLTQSDLPADSKAVGDALKFDATKYNIPVLFLYGDRINTLKDKKGSLKNEVKYSFPKYGIQGTCTNFKVQGASSATLPKKNWTLNLDQDVVIFPKYGLQHKYVVKANMSDFTQAKNVVSAKLWGNLRKTHIQNKDTIQDSLGNYLTDQNGNHIVAETDPQLAIGGNIGSVDGFPICIYVNNEYWGLYTFNIPKDDWMAKMPKKQGYAIVDTVWSPQGSFQQETNLKDSMELQFCGTKDNTWVRNSINKLIDACIASYNDTDSFDLAISPYLDLDSAIDYLVFSILINNVDGVFRNFLLQTFNGKKWYFAAYDMDMTFGSKPDDWYSFSLPDYVGSDVRKGGATFENFANANRLFHQIWKFHRDQVINEVENAIQSDMSVSVVDNIFTNFDCNIPLPAFLEETKKWAGTPNTGVENLSRIYRWYDQRISWIKQHYLNNK